MEEQFEVCSNLTPKEVDALKLLVSMKQPSIEVIIQNKGYHYEAGVVGNAVKVIEMLLGQVRKQ